jgi:hypothetical protein
MIVATLEYRESGVLIRRPYFSEDTAVKAFTAMEQRKPKDLVLKRQDTGGIIMGGYKPDPEPSEPIWWPVPARVFQS